AVLLGNGDGTFAAPTILETGPLPFRLLTGDVNGDGFIDLVALDIVWWLGASAEVAVFLGQGDGTFAPLARVPVGPTAYDLAAGDVNGDGHLDLAVARLGGYSNDFPYEHFS